jgi:vacuolar protein sorting-associated protein 1
MTEVLGRIAAFCDQLRGAVYATGPDKSLAHRNKASYASHKLQIRITAPDFRPFENPSEYRIPDVVDCKVDADKWKSSGRVWGVYDVRHTIKT